MDSYKIIGIAAFMALVVMLALLVMLRPLGIHKTFSQHAAASTVLSYYYVFIFAVTFPFLYIFFAEYAAPKLSLPTGFVWLFGAACALQVLCTLVPERKSHTQILTHRVLAGL